MNEDDQVVCKAIKAGVQAEVKKRITDLHKYKQGHNIDQWLYTNCQASGGISASVYWNETVKDVDLWYNSFDMNWFGQELQDLFIAKSGKFHHLVKDVNPSYMVGTVAGKLVTANAITLHGDVQIIRLANIEDARRTFDFVHCQPVYDLANMRYSISPRQLDAIRTKRLIKTPTGKVTQHRLDKFKQRGWTYVEQ